MTVTTCTKKSDSEEIAARKAAGEGDELDIRGMRDNARKLCIGDGNLRHYYGSRWKNS